MEKINIPENNSLNSFEGISEWDRHDEYYEPIEQALERGDFVSAMELQKKLEVNDKDMQATEIVSFQHLLLVRNDYAIASRMLKELDLPVEEAQEIIVHRMSYGLFRGHYELIFRNFEKYFILTTDMKKQSIEKAIALCEKTPRKFYEHRKEELKVCLSELQ